MLIINKTLDELRNIYNQLELIEDQKLEDFGWKYNEVFEDILENEFKDRDGKLWSYRVTRDQALKLTAILEREKMGK